VACALPSFLYISYYIFPWTKGCYREVVNLLNGITLFNLYTHLLAIFCIQIILQSTFLFS
jgi:hypothetical protein